MSDEIARRYAMMSIHEELHQPRIPSHIHGTRGGYNNNGCRGPLCRMALALARGNATPPLWGPDREVWEVTRSVLEDMKAGYSVEKQS